MIAIATGSTISRARSNRKISATVAISLTAKGARGRSAAAPGVNAMQGPRSSGLCSPPYQRLLLALGITLKAVVKSLQTDAELSAPFLDLPQRASVPSAPCASRREAFQWYGDDVFSLLAVNGCGCEPSSSTESAKCKLAEYSF